MNIWTLLVLSFLFHFNVCVAQDWTWQPANGPYGGPVKALVLDREGRLFAATDSKGVFVSVNRGVSWEQTGLDSVGIGSLALDSLGALLAATSSQLYRSTDAGAHWKALLPSGTSVATTCLYVALDGRIMLGASTALYWSTNSGSTWTKWNLASTRIRSVVVTPAGSWLVGTPGGILRSTNAGSNWSKVDTVAVATAFCKPTSGRLFAGTELNGIFSSSNDGQTWSRVATADGRTFTTLIRTANDEIFASISPIDPSIPGGVMVSPDAGVSWTSLGLRNRSAYALISDGSSGLFVATYYGVYHSPYSDSVWNEVNTGLTNITVKALITPSALEVLAGTNTGMFYSSDHGAHWVNTIPELSPGNVQATASYGSRYLFFTTTMFSPLGGVYRSEDHGESWSQISDTAITGLYESIEGLLVTSRGLLIVGLSSGRIYRSMDLGESWLRVDSARSVSLIKTIAADSTGRIFLGSWGKGIYYSTDSGLKWVRRDSGLTSKNISCIVAKDSTWLFAGGSRFIHRSSDAGASWSLVLNTNVTSITVTALSITPSGNILASVGNKVLKSTDNGDTWAPDTTGLPGSQIWSIAVSSDGTAYAGGDVNPVFYSNEVTLAVPSVTSGTPDRFNLYQNYPNPFNPSTTIRIALPVRTRVRLTVWNMLGQRVAVLQDGELDAGQHETVLNARGFASGVYFYRLQAGSFIETKRLLLLR